jgi:hypothetical protein
MFEDDKGITNQKYFASTQTPTSAFFRQILSFKPLSMKIGGVVWSVDLGRKKLTKKLHNHILLVCAELPLSDGFQPN